MTRKDASAGDLDGDEGALLNERVTLEARIEGMSAAAPGKRGLVLLRLGEVLFKLGLLEEAAERLREAAAAVGVAPGFALIAVSARWRESQALMFLGRAEDALELIDELIGMFLLRQALPDSEPDSGKEAILARMRSGVLASRPAVLYMLGRWTEACDAADAMVAEFGPRATERERLDILRALIMKAKAAGAAGEVELALAALDQAVERCAGESAIAFREKIADILMVRGEVLADGGNDDAARMAYAEVEARFGSASEEVLREIVREARHRISSSLLD